MANRELTRAISLLTKALSGMAEVRRLDHRTTLEVVSPAGDRITIKLMQWDQPSDGRSELVVWVLNRQGRQVRERLRERGENFIDLSGAIRLHLPWLILDRTDVTPAKVPARTFERRNPFSDRGSQITRTLFEGGPEKLWTVRELAAEAEVSLGLASYVLTELERRGLVTIRSAGRARTIHLPNRLPIIEQWTREYDWRRNRSTAFHVPIGSPSRFLNRLPGLLKGRRWALTMQAGASLLAPHASWDLVHLYVQIENVAEDSLMIGQDQGWSPAPDGKVVVMTPWYRTSVWHGAEVIRELPVVSTLQLILDLWHYPIRGREQAEHLVTRILPHAR